MSIDTVPQYPTRVGAPELCSRCDQTVAKAKTRSGKTILMDFHPSQLGTFVIIGESGPDLVVAKIASKLDPTDERPRFSCHWSHCKLGNTRRRNYGRPMVNYSPFAH
jgi:hypothetical protein